MTSYSRSGTTLRRGSNVRWKLGSLYTTYERKNTSSTFCGDNRPKRNGLGKTMCTTDFKAEAVVMAAPACTRIVAITLTRLSHSSHSLWACSSDVSMKTQKSISLARPRPPWSNDPRRALNCCPKALDTNGKPNHQYEFLDPYFVEGQYVTVHTVAYITGRYLAVVRGRKQ